MAVRKKEQDGEHPASHYLVVEDSEKPSTWHLRVKNVDGELDPRLMGAAWAALTVGYRGNVYQGPNKAEALSKLRGLYRQIDREPPGKAIIKATLAESGDWVLEVLGNPFGSPSDLDTDGEYFSSATQFHGDKFPTPPVVYYHGFTPDGQPQGNPEYIGQTVNREVRTDGVWYTVVLDKAKELAKRVWEAARQGLARASTGTIPHLTRKGPDGHILEWPVAELSLMDIGEGRAPANRYAVAMPVLKAHYQEAGLPFPEFASESEEAESIGATAQGSDVKASSDNVETLERQRNEVTRKMSEETKEGLTAAQATEIAKLVKAELEADREAKAKEEEARAAQAAREKELVDAAKAEVKAEMEEALKASGRLDWSGGEAPTMARYGALRRFDNLSAEDCAVMIEVLKAAGVQPSESAYQAAAIKACHEETPLALETVSAMKMAGMPFEGNYVKANEINYSTLSTYGDEWVGVMYDRTLWESIRHETRLAGQFPTIEIPQGYESVVIPLESTDPTFYLVSQVTGDASTGGLSRPSPTVTSSLLGTTNQSLTLAVIGARVRWSRELGEDSIIPWANQLRAQLQRASAEQFEHVLIDGDTATTASTNVNCIAGTPGGTEAYLAANGLRKLALVTNTANSREGGAIDEDDYLETLRLLGGAGKNADPTKVWFIVDPNVQWQTMKNVTALKTRDVYSRPTIEAGSVSGIWGYPVYTSYSMHWGSRTYSGYEYKANTAGKIDTTTTSNNTTGSILAARFDQWMLGYKRRINLEVDRDIEAQANIIVATIRFGFIYRDTDAAAISYNLTV
jgi:hypothetical protein